MRRQWTLTEGALLATPDDELVQKVIFHILDFIDELAPDEDDYTLILKTPKSAHFFWAMQLLESEVNNGGFEQYFWNASSMLVDVAGEAYQAIGADKYVDFIERAVAFAGKGSWMKRRRLFGDDWRAYKSACPPALGALDDEFYAAKCGSPDSGGEDVNLHRRKIEYIRKNAKVIGAFDLSKTLAG